MKKGGALLLILLHLFSLQGYSVDVHYCLGEKTYTLFGIEWGEHCTCNHAKEIPGKGCCRDQKLRLSASLSDHIQSAVISVSHTAVLQALAVQPIVYNGPLCLYAVVLNAPVACLSSSPPGLLLPSYLIYCNWRI